MKGEKKGERINPPYRLSDPSFPLGTRCSYRWYKIKREKRQQVEVTVEYVTRNRNPGLVVFLEIASLPQATQFNEVW